MADTLLETLRAKHRRMEWTGGCGEWTGTCGDVVIVLSRSDEAWKANGSLPDGGMVRFGDSPEEALRKLSNFPVFAEVLHPDPWGPPKVERFSLAGVFWNVGKLWILGEIKAALRALSGVAWGDAAALLFIGAMALGCGGVFVWFWLGGVQW